MLKNQKQNVTKNRKRCRSNQYQKCPLSPPRLYCYRFLPFTLHESGTRKTLLGP